MSNGNTIAGRKKNKEIADFEKAIKEAQERLQEFYRKIGGFTYSETNKDKVILLLDSGVR